VHSVLAARCVWRGTEVQHGRLFGQHHEGVAESLCEKKRVSAGAIKPRGLLCAEPPGTLPQVHHHVHDRPSHTGHVLSEIWSSYYDVLREQEFIEESAAKQGQ
jgi:hypothetical protein